MCSLFFKNEIVDCRLYNFTTEIGSVSHSLAVLRLENSILNLQGVLNLVL